MSAQTVWSRIISYNLSSALLIQKKYVDTKKILAALEHYPDKDKYHGHASGSGGDGENQGASDRRQNAIDFLSSYDPSTNTSQPKKTINSNAKSNNKSHTAELKAILNSHKANLGDAKTALSLYDANWESDREVKSNYDNLKREKEEKQKNKLKQK